jgi:hypothetical protein
MLVCFILVLHGCGALSQKDKALKEFQHDEAQYQPYKVTNTIEGYREFISLYPKNLFVDEAKLQIENLEFAPYEEEDSVEGYMEFTIRYPNNRHTLKANVKIEQAEVKRYEKMDTMKSNATRKWTPSKGIKNFSQNTLLAPSPYWQNSACRSWSLENSPVHLKTTTGLISCSID